jgi:hypothetical protein
MSSKPNLRAAGAGAGDSRAEAAPASHLSAAETGPQPYTRWWWFSGPISKSAIRRQLRWVPDNGFGGVEVAWVYPLDERPGPKWLDTQWSRLVAHTKQCCEQLGLGGDFT